MKLERIRYRVGQFRKAIWAVPAPSDLKLAQTYLNPAQMELFLRMQVSDQAHSLQVFKRLLHAPPVVEALDHLPAGNGTPTEEPPSDLLVAALLHDVGKSRYPLSIWERVMAVLMKALFPGQSRSWGRGAPETNGALSRMSWRRPLVIAERHPQWGAELASAAGTSRLATALILRHQTVLFTEPANLEDRLLTILQAADASC